MTKHNFIKYQGASYDEETTLRRSQEYREMMDKRRSLRFFSDKPVDKEVIENLIMTAASAPSGAHKQPWSFCAVSSEQLKVKIREAAEEEEYQSYNGRMSEEWLDDLKKFDTNWVKEFITTAPWIVVLFKHRYGLDADGNRTRNYYVSESVGIAAGFFISAVHNAGLVTLTHTPSPMNFLQKLLERPENEAPYLLLPIGYPAEEAVVPKLDRKGEDEVISYYE